MGSNNEDDQLGFEEVVSYVASKVPQDRNATILREWYAVMHDALLAIEPMTKLDCKPA